MPVLLSLGAALVLCGLIVVTVWILGGLDTSGRHLDWGVVAALASVVSATGTIAAVVALRLVISQLEAQTRDERITRQPYLRVDVGFVEREGRSRGFAPPDPTYLFTASEFNILDRVKRLQALEDPSGPNFTLALWVTNQQDTPLGIAYNVRVRLFVGWEEGSGPRGVPIDVEFAYVEAGKTTGIVVGKVRRSIWLAAFVDSVTYEGMFGDDQLNDRHGALQMVYDHGEGEITNERLYRLGKQGE